MPPRSDTDLTPLDAAAKALGISPDATRKRLERGTLPGEKRGGRWFVDPSGLDASPENSDTPPSGQPDAMRTPPDSLRELVDHLKEENEFLRDQLDKRSRELADERERSDVLHREAFARIEALTAGSSPMADNDDSEPHNAPESSHAAQDGSGATIDPSPSDESNEAASSVRRGGFTGWWDWVRGR